METAKYFDPLEKIIELWKQFDREPLVFKNLNIRGNMITIYLPVDEMLAYANMLQQRGYADNHMENIWIHRGYARNGHYFKVGPYQVRIAQYREKLHNQQDAAYLQEKYQGAINKLKQDLVSRDQAIESLSKSLTEKETK